jgi:hypothetical protein
MRGVRALLACAVLALGAGCGNGGNDGGSDRAAEPARPPCAVEDQIYRDLREKALRVKPSEIRLRPTASLPRVYGVMMETGYPEGCSTLVALADGTASLYLGSGGGVIGGGDHRKIAKASRAFVLATEKALDRMPPSEGERLPPDGRVIIRALAYRGNRAVEAPEDDFGYDRHELSPVFHAGHEVITQIRRHSDLEP